MSCAKTTEALEMSFGLWAQGTMYLMGSQSLHVKEQFLGARMCPGIPNNTAISCAKTAKLIEIRFGLWTRVGLKEACVTWGTLVQPGEYD